MRRTSGSNAEALAVIAEAVKAAGYGAAKTSPAMDCAASEFYSYLVNTGWRNKAFTSEEFTHFPKNPTKQYPIVSIEDGSTSLTGTVLHTRPKVLSNQLVGDDLFVNQHQNPERRH